MPPSCPRHANHPTAIGWEGKLQLIAFCVFEVSVGVFWPSMMKMRAEYVPEECRATIINFFRIPLNLFVCVVLANVRGMPDTTRTTHTVHPPALQQRIHNVCIHHNHAMLLFFSLTRLCTCAPRCGRIHWHLCLP